MYGLKATAILFIAGVDVTDLLESRFYTDTARVFSEKEKVFNLIFNYNEKVGRMFPCPVR